MDLTPNALKVLEESYLKKDDSGNPVETPEEMFRRVAKNIAQADLQYGGDPARSEEEFYRVMTSLEFLPNPLIY